MRIFRKITALENTFQLNVWTPRSFRKPFGYFQFYDQFFLIFNEEDTMTTEKTHR